MSLSGIKWILFDLGGVLVELIGVPTMIEWTGGTMTVDELWRTWLHSPSVRKFEIGDCSPEEFASNMIREFNLPVNESQFLDAFISWPKGLYPGVEDILAELRLDFKLASLSNTNSLHWEKFVVKNGIDRLFDTNFPSHKTRFLKPDPEAFRNVIRVTGCEPYEILFFDDNQLNIDSAVEAGITGIRINGGEKLKNWFRDARSNR